MQGLNPQQRAAVTHLGSPLLVLAGAGSGKTRVITQKIAWLIQQGIHSADQIAAITFTNKAAREMRERASHLLTKETAKGLTVATFHTLGLSIIKRELKQLGYKAGFSILDAQDSSAILKELVDKGNELLFGRYFFVECRLDKFNHSIDYKGKSPQEQISKKSLRGEPLFASKAV